MYLEGTDFEALMSFAPAALRSGAEIGLPQSRPWLATPRASLRWAASCCEPSLARPLPNCRLRPSRPMRTQVTLSGEFSP